jgi:hypothetical protein
MNLVIAKSDYTVASGKSTIIQVGVANAANNKEKVLIWSAEKGVIDNRGRYTAPETTTDTDDTVTVTCVEDATETGQINIQVTKMAPKPSVIKNVEIKPVGADGCWTINIQCLSSLPAGIKCRIIFTESSAVSCSILPGLTALQRTAKKYVLKKSTNAAGFLSLRLNDFTEKVREIQVQVEGTDVDKMIILKGPKSKLIFNPDKRFGFWAHLTQDFT